MPANALTCHPSNSFLRISTLQDGQSCRSKTLKINVMSVDADDRLSNEFAHRGLVASLCVQHLCAKRQFASTGYIVACMLLETQCGHTSKINFSQKLLKQISAMKLPIRSQEDVLS